MLLCSSQVAKIDINYAKTAKKLDVKKLKGVIWHLLTTKSKKGAENDPASGSMEESQAEGPTEKPTEVRGTTPRYWGEGELFY